MACEGKKGKKSLIDDSRNETRKMWQAQSLSLRDSAPRREQGSATFLSSLSIGGVPGNQQ